MENLPNPESKWDVWLSADDDISTSPDRLWYSDVTFAQADVLAQLTLGDNDAQLHRHMHLQPDEEVEEGWQVYLYPVDNPVEWAWIWDDASIDPSVPSYYGYAWVSRAKYNVWEREYLARYGVVKP
jgi:hypothetical protein